MDGNQAGSIAEAVKRTAETGTAKLSFEVSLRGSVLERETRPVRWPGLLGLRGLLGYVGAAGWRLFMKYLVKQARQVTTPAAGFVDFQARRCAFDWGAYAELTHGSTQWSGRSGRAIATLPEEPARALRPLWLFDLARGVTEAAEVDTEQLRGQRCRRLRATVDLARVSEAVPDRTPVPGGASFEELRALPLDLWIDEEGYVRRIAFHHRRKVDSQTYTLELFEFGTEDVLDWSRLPLLKDPQTGDC